MMAAGPPAGPAGTGRGMGNPKMLGIGGMGGMAGPGAAPAPAAAVGAAGAVAAAAPAAAPAAAAAAAAGAGGGCIGGGGMTARPGTPKDCVSTCTTSSFSTSSMSVRDISCDMLDAVLQLQAYPSTEQPFCITELPKPPISWRCFPIPCSPSPESILSEVAPPLAAQADLKLVTQLMPQVADVLKDSKSGHLWSKATS